MRHITQEFSKLACMVEVHSEMPEVIGSNYSEETHENYAPFWKSTPYIFNFNPVLLEQNERS